MIYGANSKFNVIKGTGGGNKFKNGLTQIYINNSISSFGGNLIGGNTFDKFNNAIILNGSKSVVIKNNIFNDANQAGERFSWFKYGLQSDQSTDFIITDNKFKRLEAGIECTGSGTGSALIGFEKKGNSFTRCKTPIVTRGANEMLNIHCNNFINPEPNDYGGKNWDIDDVNGKFMDQGKASTPPSEKGPAGNIFNKDFSTDRKEIDANLSTKFLYYPHTTDFTIPTKKTASSSFDIQSGLVPFTSMNAACSITKKCTKCQKELLLLKQDVEHLKSELYNVEQSLDKGKTNELLSVITSNIPVSQLRDILVEGSPLSESVIEAIYKRSVPLPPQVFQDVFLPNSPLNSKNNELLQTRLLTLPSDIAEKLRKAQVINPPYRTLTTIQREINDKENERQLMLNDAVQYYIENDSLSLAIDLLEQENRKEVKQGLVATYIELRNYSAAEAKLNILPVNSIEDKAFNDLYSIYIKLGINNKSLWEMDSTQILRVKEIATLCPASLAVINARALLNLISNDSIPFCPVINNSNGLKKYIYLDEYEYSESPKGNQLSAETEYLGNNIPNPFDGSTYIPYYIPTGSRGILKIFSTTGELIKSYKLTEGNNLLKVSLKEFSNAVYIYNLNIDEGETVIYKKMVLNK